MVMGGDGDGSIPYQWHIFFNQHGMKTTCLALSDFSGERHKFLASLFRLALSGRFLSYHLNHTFPVICAAIIRVLHPRSNIVVSFHRSYRHMDFFAKASHLIGLIFATCITCNSNATLDSLPRLARKFRKCIVVYNGISLEEFELFDRNYADKIAPGPTVRLVAVGRLVPEKNFLSLVEAIKIVFDNSPDVNLILDIYG